VRGGGGIWFVAYILDDYNLMNNKKNSSNESISDKSKNMAISVLL